MGGLEKKAKRAVKQAKGTSSKSAGKENIWRQEEGQGHDKRALEVTGRRVHEGAAGVVAEMFRPLHSPSARIRGGRDATEEAKACATFSDGGDRGGVEPDAVGARAAGLPEGAWSWRSVLWWW